MATKTRQYGKKMTERVQRERAATTADRPETSEQTVGNLFRFDERERALVGVVVDEYDKKLKAVRKGALETDLSLVDVDTVRSRSAIVRETVTKARTTEDVTLTHPLRMTLGSALSLHARKLRKERAKMPELLVETNDLDEALEAVHHLANKLGEQLVLSLPDEEDE